MSVQYTDDSFGDIKPFDVAMDEFLDAIQKGTAKALHVGTAGELHELQSKYDRPFKPIPDTSEVEELKAKVDELSTRVDELDNKNGLIIKPDKSDILKYIK